MKTILVVAVLLITSDAQAISGGSGQKYECKVDPRGVMVCYPKPRGF